jgi:hypothetical protein
MRFLTLLGEVLPVFGTVGLLGLWLYQQTGIEVRAGELRKTAAARAVYQTYQSHNAVFNAVNEGLANPQAVARLRAYQVYNYELGLGAIEQALPAERRHDIPRPINAYDGVPFEQKMERTQKRLEVLQARLADYETSLRAAADRDHARYLWLYLVISAVSLLGALCKVADKLRGTPAPGPSSPR